MMKSISTLIFTLVLMFSCSQGSNSDNPGKDEKGSNTNSKKGNGGGDGDGEDTGTVEGSSFSLFPRAYALVADAGDCNDDREGLLVYAKSEKSFYVCESGSWAAIELKGDKGDPGVAGAVGPTGEQGVVGASGPQGATGATGPAGSQGLQGIAGPQAFLRVYDNTDTPVGYFVSMVTSRDSDDANNPSDHFHGFMMKALSANDYTVYRTAKYLVDPLTNNMTWPGNDGRAEQLRGECAGGGVNSECFMHFKSSDCTGQAYFIRNGFGLVGVYGYYRSFLTIPNTYLQVGSSGIYEFKITNPVPENAAIESYLDENAVCQAISIASISVQEASYREVGFPDHLDGGWYIAP